MTYLPFQWDSFVALPSLNSISCSPLPITLTSAFQHTRITETALHISYLSKMFSYYDPCWGVNIP